MTRLSPYHGVALLLLAVGVVGIGLQSTWLALPGTLGLAMLLVKPPRR